MLQWNCLDLSHFDGKVPCDLTPWLESAVPYLRDLNSIQMRPTPGQLFASELKSRKIKKSEFARRIKKTYQTVNNWTKGIGFHPEQRAIAARELGLPPDHFDRPDLAAQRETYRLMVLDEFRHSWPGAPLSEEEWRSVESVRFPQDKVPTCTFYEGFVHLLRGDISAAQFAQNLGPNEEAEKLNKALTEERKRAPAQTRKAKRTPQK